MTTETLPQDSPTPAGPGPSTDATPGLTPLWRGIFTLEIFICLSTVLFWVIAPGDYLEGFYGLDADAPGPYFLLQQTGIVVFCVYVYMYTRLIRSKPFNLQAFKYLQEAMAIGDVFIVYAAVASYTQLQPDTTLFATQVGMATLWGVIRVVWLVRHAWGKWT